MIPGRVASERKAGALTVYMYRSILGRENSDAMMQMMQVVVRIGCPSAAK